MEIAMKAPNIVIPEVRIAGLTRRQTTFANDVLAAGHWIVRVRRARFPDECEIDYIENLVTTVGLNNYLDAALKTGVSSPTWALGLTDGTPTAAAGDTSSSHAGWTEVTAYDEANRVAWTPGTISAGSLDNAGSAATFTISSDTTTVGGAFLIDENTKGGSTGTLQAVGAFTAGDKLLDDNDTLDVTATFTQTAS